MRTALIYSGQARSVSQTYENHAWHLRNFPDRSVFCSVAADAQVDDMFLLRDDAFKGCPFHMEKVVQPEVEEWPEKTLFHSGYPRSTTQQAVLKQIWAWNRAWEFFCEKASPEDFDVVVRVRPDTAFLRLEYSIGMPGSILTDLCLTPRWAKWGGQQDRFAILGKKAAKAYFTTWQKLPELKAHGCPCHPEQLLDASLRMDGITPSPTLRAEFLTVRLPTKDKPDQWSYVPCDVSGVDLLDAT